MTMYGQRDRDDDKPMEELRTSLNRERGQIEALAQTLSRQSIQQWQKAIEGMVALPAAFIVGMAATSLYAVAFVTRGFEIFQEESAERRRLMIQALAMRERRTTRGNESGEPRTENMLRA